MPYSERRHPYVLILWFLLILTASVTLQDPVCIILSHVGALLAAASEKGIRSAASTLALGLVITAVTTVCNGLFSHSGITLLFYVGGIPVTKEAVVYGFFAGEIFAAVLTWFTWFSSVFTQDKMLYVLRRIAPSAATVVVMTFSFVPRLGRKAEQIAEAQREARPAPASSTKKRMVFGVDALNALITWSMEHSIVTADSMNARGYGIGRRTNSREYRLRKGDLIPAVVCGVLLLILFSCFLWGWGTASYFPMLSFWTSPLWFYLIYAAAVCSPFYCTAFWRMYICHLLSKISR